MKVFIWQSLLVAVTIASLTTLSAAQSTLPISETIFLGVSNRADLGTNGFDIRISGNLDFLPGVSLTAPDGTIFKNYGPGRTSMNIESLTLNQITDRFAGEWIINDDRNFPTGVSSQHHRFSLSALDLSTFPPTTPQIISPAEGARLPVEFDVVRTGSGGISLSGDYTHFATSSTHVDLRYMSRLLPEVVEARTWSSVSTTTSADPLDVSPVRQFRIAVSKLNLSPPVSWTVGLPEPSTIALGSVAPLSLAALRRRK